MARGRDKILGEAGVAGKYTHIEKQKGLKKSGVKGKGGVRV